MNAEIFNLATFNSTHSAIRAEKELIAVGIKIKIIPVPTEITANCGLSIKMALEDLEKVRKVLSDNNIEVSGYYYVKKLGFEKDITPIED